MCHCCSHGHSRSCHHACRSARHTHTAIVSIRCYRHHHYHDDHQRRHVPTPATRTCASEIASNDSGSRSDWWRQHFQQRHAEAESRRSPYTFSKDELLTDYPWHGRDSDANWFQRSVRDHTQRHADAAAVQAPSIIKSRQGTAVCKCCATSKSKKTVSIRERRPLISYNSSTLKRLQQQQRQSLPLQGTAALVEELQRLGGAPPMHRRSSAAGVSPLSPKSLAKAVAAVDRSGQPGPPMAVATRSSSSSQRAAARLHYAAAEGVKALEHTTAWIGPGHHIQHTTWQSWEKEKRSGPDTVRRSLVDVL